MCRVFGLLLWALVLFGALFYGAMTQNNTVAAAICAVVALALVLVCGYIGTYNRKVLRRDFDVLPSLGIVLEHVGLYPNLTGLENLEYLASLRGRAQTEDLRGALLRVGLDPNDSRTYRKYSLGMKQRLAIAQAVMERPDVIMLDEPTNGLDEDGVKQIRTLIQEERSRGAMVLLASHNREDIRVLADHSYRIKDGAVVPQEDAP